MRTLLICHDGATLDQEGLARWLGSFSEVAGILVIREPRSMMIRRARREIRRVGPVRFLDVLSFRAYYASFLSGRDRSWERQRLGELCALYKPLPAGTSILYTRSPNSEEAEGFIRDRGPHIVIARCKHLLKEKIFSIPPAGTLVMHPGICPEYRNSHGCFWALANGDLGKVGMTLLRIDKGVDTGPVYGYYTYDFDEVNETHVVIQHRVVLENLDALRGKIVEIYAGKAMPLAIQGRPSLNWGQPWLTRYLRWKRDARRRL